MANVRNFDNELTPEAVEILRGIVEETRGLRELDLDDVPPSTAFETDR
jgi:hypothetical protein